MAEALTLNSYELACARAEYLRGFGVLDAKRPTAWTQYGYKESLDFADFFAAYERGGAGHGAVHRILDGCWQDVPRLKNPGQDEESTWETAVTKLFDDLNLWGKLKDFDRRNLIGRYAGLVYRIKDGKLLNEPLTNGKLLDIVPLYESQIRVTKWNEDATSERYGQPEMFEIETSPPPTGPNDARPRTWLKVHPSRMQILAEGAVNGDFYNGVPLLKAGFNNLVDLEKIAGGSGESFLKNSARTIAFEYDKDATVQAITANPDGSQGTKTVRQVHSEQARELNRNLDASIVMQGGKANTLQTTISDPTGAFTLAGNLFAASIRLPFTIMFGQQTGRLASDEDKADANSRYKARRRFELTPMLKELVTRLQACGALDAGDFEIEWPELGAPTDSERLDASKKMADTNKAVFDGGGFEPVFDAEEIRKAAGYEQRKGSEGDDFKEDDPDPAPGDPAGKPVTKPAEK